MSGPIIPGPDIAPPGSNATALSIIKSAMRLIHVLAPGEEPSGIEANDALRTLNQMIDGWNAERLMMFAVGISDFPLESGKQSYTLGVGGDFNIVQPTTINSASILILNNPDRPIEIPIPILGDSEWQESYPVKNIPSTFPQAVYDDQNFPLKTYTFWPTPIDLNSFRIYYPTLLTQFPSLQASYGFPAGYLEALRYNLALVMADEWNGELGQTVVAGAIGSKARIKANNVTIETLKCDPAVTTGGTGVTNYRADMFNIP